MALPKPVSMSATTGRPERSAMPRLMSGCWVIDPTLTSGTPYIADSSKPDAQIASKPASATSMADKGLCAAIASTRPLLASTSRNFAPAVVSDPFVPLGGGRILAPALDLIELVELGRGKGIRGREMLLGNGERHDQ